MPARTATRAPRSSASSTTKSRSSSQQSPDSVQEDTTPLRTNLCQIFADAQRSTTGHRKLVVSLRKIQEACCYEPSNPSKNGNTHEEYDENDFAQEVERCVFRVLVVKKSEGVGDRTVRFLGAFLRHATELDNAIFQDEGEQDEQAVPETPSSRLSAMILGSVLPLLSAKDKIVRYRSTQIVAHLINTLDSVDDDLFDQIRLGLIKRLRDKESNVRVQAVYGLGRLAGEVEDEQQDVDSDDDTAGGVLEKLLDVLQNDPSADVRRSLLLNLPFTPTTLPFLLERARDVDASIRRALYSRLLPALGDFRHLSLTHREKLLRWGLRDRDDNVRKATAKLFRERWIEDCARPPDAEPADMKQLSAPTSDGLLELLERIDVVNAGIDGGIALDAMEDFWEGRPDYRDYLTFDGDFWKLLTPESAFVARTFNDFCRTHQDSSIRRLGEDKMPEVTRIAFLIQHNVNILVESIQKIALQDDAEEDSVQQEFVVEQLLHIALTLDYSDEIGRRKMFSLMTEALSLAELPEEVTRLVVEVLRGVCDLNDSGEREFCRVVLEAIAEVHDTIMSEEPENKDDEDESFHSARSEVSGDGTPSRPKPKTPEEEQAAEEKAIREIMVNMKCLHIAQCMLQNVEGNLEENVHLVTMLNNLVVPAVRSQEAPIRERGLLCLGLCCLLDKSLAEENLTLFLHCFNKGHATLQNIAIQIIGDILTAHPILLVPKQDEAEASALHKPLQKLFSKAFKSPDSSIQSTACAALCKLMLSAPSGENKSILNTDDLLRLATIAYFDPQNAGNPALRQALSYFLPVYCHSRRENMQRMGRLVMPVLRWCLDAKDEMDVDGGDDPEMVGLAVVVSHLVDWTDGRRLVNVNLPTSFDEGVKEADSNVHLDVTSEVLEKLLGTCSREEKKAYISLLGKIFISPTSDKSKLDTAAELVNEAIEHKIAADATSRNALLKLQTAISKAISTATPNNPSRDYGSIEVGSEGDAAERASDGAEHLSNADDTTILESVELETPAPSPSKRSRGKSAATEMSDIPSPTPTPTRAPEQSLLDDDEDTIMGEASPIRPASRAPPAAAELEMDTTSILTSTFPDESLLTSTPVPDSPAKRTRSRQKSTAPLVSEPTAKPKAQSRQRSRYEEEVSALLDSSHITPDDIDQSELPSELPSMISEAASVDSSLLSETPQPPRTKRTAAMPAPTLAAKKGPLATLAQAPAGARRSVRASRRKTEFADEL